MSTSTAMPDYLDPDSSAKRSRLPWILVIVGLVAAVVIGGGALAVRAMMGSGSDQPSSAMPSTVAAYAQIDIDPSVGQKVAALQFFDGLDTEELEEMRDGKGREALFGWISEEDNGALGDMNYEEDVKPWLGDRAGVGVLPGATADDLVPVVAIQVKDEAAATSFLDRLMAPEEGSDEVDYFFRGDYVVFSQTSDLEGVKMALDAGTLADSAEFSDDMAAIGDQGIVSMWANLPAFQELSNSMSEELGATMSEFSDGTPFIDGEAKLEGRMAGTLRFDKEAIELYAAAFDAGGEKIEGGDSAHLISTLPADTTTAFSFEHGDQYVDQIWTLLNEAYPDDVAEAQQMAADEGFALPDDIKTMLGNSAVFSTGADLATIDETLNGEGDSADIPSIGYQASTDSAAAVALVDKIMALGGEEELAAEGIDLPYGAEGDTFIITSNQSYYDALKNGGDLSSDRDFTVAVPDADAADAAGYINLNAFEPLYLEEFEAGQERDMAKTMAAIGMRTTSDDEGGATFSLRLVFDEKE